MPRFLLYAALSAGLLAGSVGHAQSDSGCLSTSPPITWTLPNTPGTPNWMLSSNGIKLDENSPTAPFVPVPFTAIFWRRPQCPTQLLVTYAATAEIDLGIGLGFTASQAGYDDSFSYLVVNDPAAVAGNLFGFNLQGPISGVVPLSSDNIDLSQPLTISFTPEMASGLSLTRGSPVLLQIPAASSSVASFAIGSGMTGSWYDATQSGHGFEIEVLPTNPLELLAYWFVYAPDGGAAWIVGTGPITGNTAVLSAFQTAGSGGRFPPNFNAAYLQAVPWGTMKFTFTDCNNGIASWQPTAAGYTAGSIPITRLTMPAGLTCP